MAESAIVFGAGNIGRGFIGQLFSESGYDVVFVDIDEELVNKLNREGNYHLQTVMGDVTHDYRIGPVRAVNGRDIAAVATAVSNAAVGATAVGAGALKFITPALAEGISVRLARHDAPFNILICENLKGAAQHVRQLVLDRLPESAGCDLPQSVGFVDTVIGRMVPVPTAEMRARDVSFIRVEPYKELPVDRSGFVGPVPSISAMTAYDNFGLFTARKLYIHNCGHALLAYAGYLFGCEFGFEALEHPDVNELLQGGLRESIAGIVSAYAADRSWLEAHVDDLLVRFSNSALGDTVLRLGRDPVRKLAPTDRLVGAAQLSMSTGVVPLHLCWGIACAFYFDPADDPSAQRIQGMRHDDGDGAALKSVTGLDPESVLGETILRYMQILSVDRNARFPGL